MTPQAFAEWFTRGRSHQADGRTIDAMLCLRRALREFPESIEARVHLGEVLWQLERRADAIAAWRDVATAAARDHGSPRVQAAAAIASLWDGDDDSAQAQIIAAAIAADPQVVRAASLGDALGALLDERRPDRALGIVVEALGFLQIDTASAQAMPAVLIALALEQIAKSDRSGASAEWRNAVAARRWSPSEHDALRRAALAMFAGAPDDASALAQRYAGLCARHERGSAPVAWPARTRGERLRIAEVCAKRSPDDARRSIEALPADRFAVNIIDVTQPLHARDIAALDADILVDLVGLEAPIGTVLAQRPARERITIATIRCRNHPPLIDHVSTDAQALVERLSELERETAVTRGCAITAGELNALWTRAVEAHRDGDRTAARAQYLGVLEHQSSFAPAHYLLGVMLREDGDLDGARGHFNRALASSPRYAAARADAIRLALDAGDLTEAWRLIEASCGLDDEPPPSLLRAFGAVALAAHDGSRAATWFEAALSQDPLDGETHYNHGVALQSERRYAEAARAYQRALVLRPDFVAADFNLGTIFVEQGNPDGAIAAFSAVVARSPLHVAAYKQLGQLFFDAGRIDAWRDNFDRFEKHCADTLPFAVHALELCQYLGDFKRIDHVLQGLRDGRFTSRDSHELVDELEQLFFILLHFDVDSQLIHRLSLTYDRAAQRVYGDPLPRAGARRPGKLRIGYLSADLRNHVMGKMIYQAIRHHDRQRFDIALYSLSAESDEWTRRFEAVADRFARIAALDERRAAERIAADDLDILVDLSTHTKGAKPGILVCKPARVQITHIASAGSLGLSAMDFKLTDRYADIPESQSHQIERLLPMDGCVYPYRHIEPAAQVRFTRQSLGVPPDAVVIGAFVSALKLSRRCLFLWRKVLDALPRARLAFSPMRPALVPLYVRIAAACGIDAARLMFVPQSAADEENQNRYRLIDFVLDPMPYGGVNGTLEPLDMGVPVVTLVGKRHAERTSFSILSNLDVTQTIARNADEYVSIAIRLANDKRFMADVRAAIRDGLARSPLTDMPMHTRNLEAAYIDALRQRAPEALQPASAAPAVSL